VLSGVVNVHVPDKDGQVWFELRPGDGFFVPEGARHAYLNMGGEAASLIFGIAPSYDPRG
jgi:mannose-6-phosphate isomerase-like protein (cupin superfamily)